MNLKDVLAQGLTSTTKVWKSEMRKADRNDRMPSYRRFYSDRRTIKDAIFRHLEEAYNKTSTKGKYWANARQIWYALRPLIQDEVDKKLDKETYEYFSGSLLKDYIEENRRGSELWRVVWDDRGHFREPHTGKRIGVGGIEVLNYTNAWTAEVLEDLGFIKPSRHLQTIGPANRFSSVLFIEKEGFNELLEDENIGRIYDMAIMSTKGMPVKAACDLLQALPADVRIFCLHDFDKSGFTILKTLRQGTRLADGSEVIDLGFRLEDVAGLPAEDVSEKTDWGKAQDHLLDCGASEQEVEFLIPSKQSSYHGWRGKRVELNTMTSEEFIKWLKAKLDQHKLRKILPAERILEAAYRRAVLGKKVESFVQAEEKDLPDYDVPKSLAAQVRKHLKKFPEESWDAAIWDLAEGDDDDDE